MHDCRASGHCLFIDDFPHMPRSLIALGSNLGDRSATLERAVESLAAVPHSKILARSRWHETAPVGGPSGQQAFLNGAVLLETNLTALPLLEALRAVERTLGRIRDQRWGARTIDVDLLLYDQQVIETPVLSVPHPRMAFRRFVLRGAVEIAPDWVHPTIGWTLRALLMHLDAAAPYVALLGMPLSGKTALAASLASRFAGRFLADPVAPNIPKALVDPSSRDCQRQIQFLDLRSELLEVHHWQDRQTLAVSDFYFDQSLAYARLELDAPASDTFFAAWQAARNLVVPPKLLVVLDQPIGTLSEPASEPLRAELLRLAARPGIGPMLYAGNENAVTQFEEIAAAIEAMT